MLPSNVNPSPKRNRNQERTPPDRVESKPQMRIPLAMKMSPQMEQRIDAVLDPYIALRTLQLGRNMKRVVRAPYQ